MIFMNYVVWEEKLLQNMINESLHLLLDPTEVDKKPTRNGYGRGVVEAGEKHEEVVVLTGDLRESTRSQWFADKFPERFFDLGVAEQNLMGVSAGMAMEGKIPFVASYAVFNPGRNWEQLRVSVCYSDLNVKIVGSHAGITVGADGATHQGLEDIALTRVLPNMTVVSPIDFEQARKATVAVSERKGPVYLRFHRNKTPIITTRMTPFEIGKAQVLRRGKDVGLLATGPMAYEALMAAEELADKIDVEVLNIHTIKPLDKGEILRVAQKTRKIVTVEDHQKAGGMGSAVAELLSEEYPTKLIRVGVDDSFGESGDPEDLLDKYDLGRQAIMNAVFQISGTQ